MKIGAVFPQAEFGDDSGAVKEWTKAVEAMGFDHVDAFDHVIGANTANRPDWKGPYTLESEFYEPFTLFSYMSAISEKLGFISGVFILPQRQTVLFAKQAACLDGLCGGRLRLGIGTGWNAVEYEALDVPFDERGDIFDDQIAVLRKLWSERSVTVKTKYHTITDAGLKPMPLQKPIPLWFGGGGMHAVYNTPAPLKVVKRIARLADGWIPTFSPDDAGVEFLEQMRGYAREYGRDPSKIGLQVRLRSSKKNEGQWRTTAEAWRKLGATHLSVITMYDGLRGAEQHLKRLEEVRSVL